MKKYEYVPVDLLNRKTTTAESSEHRAVIDSYAAKGYRYAGYIPSLIGPSGKVLRMDLIFETDA